MEWLEEKMLGLERSVAAVVLVILAVFAYVLRLGKS